MAGAVVVTTPQRCRWPTRRAVEMYQKLNIPVIGIIENMRLLRVRRLRHRSRHLRQGGGEALALELGVPCLVRCRWPRRCVPVAMRGDPSSCPEPNSPAAQALSSAAARVAQQVSIASCAESHPADASQLIPFTKHSLGNGLQVVVHEDHHLPVVAVNIWYHVGSRNEAPGRSGLAHLFEHLMFRGPASAARVFEPLQEAGSSSTDPPAPIMRTTGLWCPRAPPSWRCGWKRIEWDGSCRFERQRFETEREVVLNERRQSYDNRPYGLASFALSGDLSSGPSVSLAHDRLSVGSPGRDGR